MPNLLAHGFQTLVTLLRAGLFPYLVENRWLAFSNSRAGFETGLCRRPIYPRWKSQS